MVRVLKKELFLCTVTEEPVLEFAFTSYTRIYFKDGHMEFAKVGNKYKISELITDKSTYCVEIETNGSNMPEIGSDYGINLFVQGNRAVDLRLQIKDTSKNAKVE